VYWDTVFFLGSLMGMKFVFMKFRRLFLWFFAPCSILNG